MPTVTELLDFEAAHPQHRKQDGWKEEAIRARFGIPPARYYVLLHRAVVTREGIAHDPVTSRRVRDRIAA